VTNNNRVYFVADIFSWLEKRRKVLNQHTQSSDSSTIFT
jgi:hypothetical protein